MGIGFILHLSCAFVLVMSGSHPVEGLLMRTGERLLFFPQKSVPINELSALQATVILSDDGKGLSRHCAGDSQA